MLGIVYRVLTVLELAIAGLGDDDPAFQAVQMRLAETQNHARERVLANTDIKAVRWELYAGWLRARGIQLP